MSQQNPDNKPEKDLQEKKIWANISMNTDMNTLNKTLANRS